MSWRKLRLELPFSRKTLISSFSSRAAGGHGRRAKKMLYHREPELDRAMDLAKKPALLLLLRSLLLSHPSPLPLRDLEKHVGFALKWRLLPLLERYPSLFFSSVGPLPSGGRGITVALTAKAAGLSGEEAVARAQMEPILARNLQKLLMLSADCRIPMSKIEMIQSELGLPANFRSAFVDKFPGFFSVRNMDGVDFLCLENWDSSLAVTAREQSLDLSASVVTKDGNFNGPFAFKLRFPVGFRPNREFVEAVIRWQKMAFPSPYLSARRVEMGSPQARKRTVAILHELLSLTMEKRLTSDKLEAFQPELWLPNKLLLCLVNNHGIFYITNKGAHSTVFLKEAYRGGELLEKCPLLRFHDRFISLIGRTCAAPERVLAPTLFAVGTASFL